MTRTGDIKKAKYSYCNGNWAKNFGHSGALQHTGAAGTGTCSCSQETPQTGLPRFYPQAHPRESKPPFLPTFFWACKISLSTGDTKTDPPS